MPLCENRNQSAENFPDFQIMNFEQCEFEKVPEELEFKAEEVDGEDEDISRIPSVKPWTLEELAEIDREIKERKKKMKMKNKKKENILKNHIKDLETSDKLLPDSKFSNITTNYDCFIHEQFYDCERFCSKLGLNPGFTKKIRKIQ